MRTHILFILMTIFVTACASHEHQSYSKTQQQEKTHYSMNEGPANRTAR